MLSSKIRYLTLFLTVFLMSSAQAGIITLNVESAGFDADIPPGFARLNVDGVDALSGGSTRGVNVAVIDESTGGVISTSAFDTHGYASESAQLVTFINNLAVGRIVMIGVQDEATGNFTTNARTAIASLGGSANNILSGGYRGSYGLIGIAGAGQGTRTAFEIIGTRYQSAVSVTDTISVPAPFNAATFLAAMALLGLSRARKA